MFRLSIGHLYSVRESLIAMIIASDHLWEAPREFVLARHDEVHVWRASLAVAPSSVQSLNQILSQDERDRAERFHFRRDQRDFIVSRALLRILIGRYLQQKPDQFGFRYNSYGKPFVAGRSHGVRFNLSHSHGLALYAVACDREIGVDLERISDRVNSDELAQHYFSPSEVAGLRALPRSFQKQAFFSCWTRKEAYIKALGEGLSVPLDSFSVSLTPGDPAALLDVQTNPEETARWSLMELRPDPRYAAALAVEGRNWGLKCWELTADIQKLPSTSCSAYDASS